MNSTAKRTVVDADHGDSGRLSKALRISASPVQSNDALIADHILSDDLDSLTVCSQHAVSATRPIVTQTISSPTGSPRLDSVPSNPSLAISPAECQEGMRDRTQFVATYVERVHCERYSEALQDALEVGRQALSYFDIQRDVDAIVRAVLVKCRQVSYSASDLHECVMRYTTMTNTWDCKPFTFFSDIVLGASMINNHFRPAVELIIEQVFAHYKEAIARGMQHAWEDDLLERAGLDWTVKTFLSSIKSQCDVVRPDSLRLSNEALGMIGGGATEPMFDIHSDTLAPLESTELRSSDQTPETSVEQGQSTSPQGVLPLAEHETSKQIPPRKEISLLHNSVAANQHALPKESLPLEESAIDARLGMPKDIEFGEPDSLQMPEPDLNNRGRLPEGAIVISLLDSDDEKEDGKVDVKGNRKGRTSISHSSSPAHSKKSVAYTSSSYPTLLIDDEESVASDIDQLESSESFDSDSPLKNLKRPSTAASSGSNQIQAKGKTVLIKKKRASGSPLAAVDLDAKSQNFNQLLDNVIRILKKHCDEAHSTVQDLLQYWTVPEIKSVLVEGLAPRAKLLIHKIHHDRGGVTELLETLEREIPKDKGISVVLVAVRWSKNTLKKLNEDRTMRPQGAVDAVHLLLTNTPRNRFVHLLRDGDPGNPLLNTDRGLKGDNKVNGAVVWRLSSKLERSEFFQPKADSGFKKRAEVTDALVMLARAVFINMCWSYQKNAEFNSELRSTFPRAMPCFGLNRTMGFSIQYKGEKTQIRKPAAVYNHDMHKLFKANHGTQTRVLQMDDEQMVIKIRLTAEVTCTLPLPHEMIEKHIIRSQDLLYVKFVSDPQSSFTEDGQLRGLKITIAKVHCRGEVEHKKWHYRFADGQKEAIRQIQEHALSPEM